MSPPVAAARPTNRMPYMAALSEEVCIVRCHKRLSKELCLRLVGRAFVGGYGAQGEPGCCRVNVMQEVRNAWWQSKGVCAETSGVGKWLLQRGAETCVAAPCEVS
jgi:hypothetical protein